MELLIEKLNQMKDNKQGLTNWSLEEQKQLLDIYLIISKKESHIYKLIYNYHGCDNYRLIYIYNYHGCDSWEDIFRDYDTQFLEDKATGVEIAIEKITEKINSKNQKQ